MKLSSKVGALSLALVVSLFQQPPIVYAQAPLHCCRVNNCQSLPQTVCGPLGSLAACRAAPFRSGNLRLNTNRLGWRARLGVGGRLASVKVCPLSRTPSQWPGQLVSNAFGGPPRGSRVAPSRVCECDACAAQNPIEPHPKFYIGPALHLSRALGFPFECNGGEQSVRRFVCTEKSPCILRASCITFAMPTGRSICPHLSLSLSLPVSLLAAGQILLPPPAY